jgi:hypothetical protein
MRNKIMLFDRLSDYIFVKKKTRFLPIFFSYSKFENVKYTSILEANLRALVDTYF